MAHIEGFDWLDDPELHESHSQHTRPVRGCFLCDDLLDEARELEAEWHPIN
jgi:hypothetical protein